MTVMTTANLINIVIIIYVVLGIHLTYTVECTVYTVHGQSTDLEYSEGVRVSGYIWLCEMWQ